MSMLTFDQYNNMPTPEQILQIYNSGFQGVRPDRAHYAGFRRVLPRFYDVFGDARGLGAGKVSLPFKAALVLEPEFWTTFGQVFPLSPLKAILWRI